MNASDVDHSYHLLRAKYRQLTADGNMGANFLLARGEAFAKKREYRAAAAAYLGSASETLRHERFERAQPALRAAFALAPKLTSDEKRDFLSVLREATSDLRSLLEQDWVHKRALAIALTINDDGLIERTTEITDLARIDISEGRAREAESALTAMLSQLIDARAQNSLFSSCLEQMARAYEADRQPEMSKQCWSRLIALARDKEGSHFIDLLDSYLYFLLNHNMNTEAVAIGNEFLARAWQPDELQRVHNYSWATFATKFANVDPEEAFKFYDAAYKVETRKLDPPIVAGYGVSAIPWAKLLVDKGRIDEAKMLLKRALSYSTSLNDQASLDAVTKLFTDYEKLLRSIGELQEADSLKIQYEKDLVSLSECKRKAAMDRDVKTLASPDVQPEAAIQVLLRQSQNAVNQKDGSLAVSLMNQAVSLFESTELRGQPQSRSSYSAFRNVRHHLAECGRADEGTEFLWRLVKKRLEIGFPDPDYSESHGAAVGLPDVELLGRDQTTGRDYGTDSKFFSLAKASNNPINVIVALNYLRQDGHKDCAYYEEVEEWRKKGDPGKYAISVLQTATEYARVGQIEAAETKVKSATKLMQGLSQMESVVRKKLISAENELSSAFIARNELQLVNPLLLDAFSSLDGVLGAISVR